MKTLPLAIAMLAASAVQSFPAQARSIDIVPVADLNFRFADCQPLPRTYDLKKYNTIYYGAVIVCHVNVAYINYDQKWQYQAG